MDKEEKIQIVELHKEIDLIQSCINRMAGNSFLLKGWLVSVIAIIMTIGKDGTSKAVIITTAAIVTFSFWYLDAIFLRNERLYRAMYKWVLEKRAKGDRELQYDLDPRRFNGEVDSVGKIMRSNTLKFFYGMVLLLIVLVTVYYYHQNILNLICGC